MTGPAYRFGIEEEFFLADAATRGTPRGGVRGFHAAAKALLPAAERELLQSQIEIATPPATSSEEARAGLASLRRGLAEIGRAHGILVFGAGTHPGAAWDAQRPTDGARYHGILDEVRMVGQRTLVSGMHVHVEVARPDDRVDLMNRLLPFLPVLLALSVSSPFWEGRDTGLCGYRLSVFGEMPRTGLPDLFSSNAEFERYVAVMTRAGAIEDASFLWWHLRPSIRYPTLELRIADSCTRVEDAVAIAGLYRCLVRAAERRPDLNAGLDGVARAVIRENLWRAQRDGVRAALIDAEQGRALPYGEALEAVLAQVSGDAAELGCTDALDGARRIARDGTSADRQRAAYTAARGDDGADEAGIAAVVDALARETEGRAV
ncbi:carboxylate-amine ligase [Methylobacterium frigidaeris]|uniref:Putative glutamate--cysteine ligase 2 n=1 Tax=Methylobacterium frigidaeris TaxID=2038277 RepID=A0AA37HCS5_9HYPH|nr:carboxylate-amine ligase [Methylobacterium frigidaeris]PIK70272.1 carboxylate-amine ligase [Methylobacterium frigidaeris]GJD63588.1 Putative glutamate--cysteine ligase 2 [Methylobacterium frigidaeris]